MDKLPLPLEHQIQQEIINYLKFRGWYVMRLNSGRMPYTYKGKQKFMMLAEKGTPDILAFKKAIWDGEFEGDAELYFIEVKRQGNKPTALQLAKMRELEEYGAQCICVHSLEELQREGL